MVIQLGYTSNKILLVWQADTYQLLCHPLSTFCQKFEIWVGMNVEYVEKLGLKKGPNIDPFLVNLLNSIKSQFKLDDLMKMHSRRKYFDRILVVCNDRCRHPCVGGNIGSDVTWAGLKTKGFFSQTP